MMKPRFLYNFPHTIQGTLEIMPGPSAVALRGSNALALPPRTSTVSNPSVRPLVVPKPPRLPTRQPQLQYVDSLNSLHKSREHQDYLKNCNARIQKIRERKSKENTSEILAKLKANTITYNDLVVYLNQMLGKTTFTDFEKEAIDVLQEYFILNPLKIEEALLFIDICKACGFVSKDFILNLTENAGEVVICKEKKAQLVKKPYKEQVEDAKHNQSHMIHNMQAFFKENQPNALLGSPLLLEWHTYVNHRMSALPFSEEELAIHNVLKDIYEKNKPDKENLIKNKKDNLKSLKEQSSLPESFKQQDFAAVTDCITLGDFLRGINTINEALIMLDDKKDLNTSDIKLLAIGAGAATMDDEGTFKITEEAYGSFAKFATDLQLRYHEENPLASSILEKIKSGNFVVVHDSPPKPTAIVNSSYQSHKSIAISTEVGGEIVYVRICILTSTDDVTTVMVDKYQQTNPDPTKQSKEQYIRPFNNSMLVTKDEFDALTVDIKTTLLFQGYNASGIKFSELLHKAFLERIEFWSKSPYLLPYLIDDMFIRKLTLKFYEQKLHVLTSKFKTLSVELGALSSGDYHDRLTELLHDKERAYKQKIDNQYQSLLPKSFRLLHQAITLFQEKLNKTQALQKKQEEDKIIDALMEKRKQKAAEEKAAQPKSARQRREELQAAKANKDNIQATNEQDT